MQYPKFRHGTLPIKVYECVGEPDTVSAGDGRRFLVKLKVYLLDRPGSLAAFASLIADHDGNIGFFHYDRSIDANRVAVEIQFADQPHIDAFVHALTEKGYAFDRREVETDEIAIVSLESILEITVRLENRPGTLAAFAHLLKQHDANVIYMLYDEDIEPESADIALATEHADEVDRLLGEINAQGYHYRVRYRGSGETEVEHIIGLKMVEKFFLRLRKLLGDKDVQEVREIVNSSHAIHSDLVGFYSEAGNNLDIADTYSNVLALASTSLSNVGERFRATELPSLRFGDVELQSFRLPTGGNMFIFRHGDELTMFDTGYGLYYDDVKKLLRDKSLEPARIRRLFVSHADADHAGMSGHFKEEFGCEVVMHPSCAGVIENENRAHGTNSKLLELHRYYTRLVNGFTRCRFPKDVRYFSISAVGMIGQFNVIDRFRVGDLEFLVLESHGGHVPGQVFFFNREYGLWFTSDYLIDLNSLSGKDREFLTIARYLMTSTNNNSAIFGEEMAALRAAVSENDAELAQQGKHARIFPGHGEYYAWK